MRAAVRVMVLVVVAVLLGVTVNRVAAGTPTTASPSPVAPVTPRPPGSSLIVLTRADNGTTVTARVGQVIVVQLPGGTLHWSKAQLQPSSDSSGSVGDVLGLLSGTTAADGSSTTRFRVLHGGTATLTATGAPNCATGGACPMFLLLWRSVVTVSGAVADGS